GAISAALPAQAGFGTIKGRLVWGGGEVPAQKVLVAKGAATQDPVCGKNAAILSHELEVDPKTKGVRYGFAYVFQPKGTNPAALKALLAKTPTAIVDQNNCDFVPHSIALVQDQPILFTSNDATGHNVHFTAFVNGALNQMLPAKAKLQKKLVAEKRPIPLSCDIHPWMKGHIMVFDHPFFAVTEADGSFTIEGVPAGAQNIVLWQESVGYVTPGAARGMKVDVKAGATTDVGDILLKPKK
ncbi:carboxypeptidase regulatory-like domain-containing protein, partial [Singulisphaera rosea]